MTVDSEDVIDCMARMKGDNQPFALATVVRTKAATSAKVGAKAVIVPWSAGSAAGAHWVRCARWRGRRSDRKSVV